MTLKITNCLVVSPLFQRGHLNLLESIRAPDTMGQLVDNNQASDVEFLTDVYIAGRK